MTKATGLKRGSGKTEKLVRGAVLPLPIIDCLARFKGELERLGCKVDLKIQAPATPRRRK
jgi:hypothetical protein